MQIDIATATMIGGQMEDDLNAAHGIAGNTRFTQVRLDKLHTVCLEVGFNIRHAAAGEIVDDAYVGAPLDERVGQMGSDKRSPTGNENFLTIPDDVLHWFRGLRLPGCP